MGNQAHGGNIVWASALAGCAPSAVLDFSASISPLGPPSSVLNAICSHLHDICHYPDPNYSELRLALSRFHQVPPEWILPGNGSAELLTLAARELAELSATVLMTPAFGDYSRALAAYGSNVLSWSLVREPEVGNQESTGFEARIITDLSGILDFTKINPDSGLILNNPHNPTGFLISREAIACCLERFKLVIVDEAFMDFLPPHLEQSLMGLVEEFPNLVILRSLTKFYAIPGLRFGYAIAHPERLRRWQSWRDPWSVNTLAAVAAVAGIADTEFQLKTWQWLPDARNELFAGLSQIASFKPFPGNANYLLVKTKQSSLELQQKLLQNHQILIRDCMSFPELGNAFFRIAVRTSAENQRLLTALKHELKVSN
ncbi:threonine-phosphate decarboxylase CobD [Calothrix sp. PCC 6303]|uniref:threonine-phosphate decarboxylase CobD n=1 Tax=Calothrix sp. PCC 6303 TaxID=1170562 RepID=UPI0002A00B72|nr:threonine-phosphate decarboxylase CobD [Calothrix sp. PCC 6303]AFZ03052.1 L-threonine O-3-phosphate decarboxylase [Calothrix sp. PCC 6303]